MYKTKFLTLIFVGISAFLPAQNAFGYFPVQAAFQVFETTKVIKTELYFGMSKPDGTEVSEIDWEKFLADEVTKRFPEGLTGLAAVGQYKDRETQQIGREKTKLLILIYPVQEKKERQLKIEEIRKIYIENFKQQAVLRIDSKAEMK